MRLHQLHFLQGLGTLTHFWNINLCRLPSSKDPTIDLSNFLYCSIGVTGTISLVTDYPYDDVATVVVINNAPLPVYLRIPVWANNASVFVNERQIAAPNGTMLKVSRAIQ